MAPKLRWFVGCLLVALPLDQLTKLWIASNLSYSDRLTVVEGFFYITHVRNPGAAFGLFASADATWRLTFFIGVGLVAIAIIFSFYRKLAPGDRLSAAALGLILGGAVGNLIDRIAYGEVVDFLHFRLWQGYVWPDFNFADTTIVIGVGLLILELLATEGEQRGQARDAEEGSSPSG